MLWVLLNVRIPDYQFIFIYHILSNSSDKRGGRLNFPISDIFPPDTSTNNVENDEKLEQKIAEEESANQRQLDHEQMMHEKYLHDPRPEFSGSGAPTINISPSGSLAPAPPVPPPIVLPPAPPPPAPISKNIQTSFIFLQTVELFLEVSEYKNFREKNSSFNFLLPYAN